jgi:hypothetical protein
MFHLFLARTEQITCSQANLFRFLYCQEWIVSELVSDIPPLADTPENPSRQIMSVIASFLKLQSVQWALYFPQTLCTDMGINLGRFAMGMTQKFLNITQIRPSFQKMGGKAMVERMH